MNDIKALSRLIIRDLKPDDAQELSYLELAIFPAPWSESSLRSCLELANVRGEAALDKGKIVGYLFAQCAADEAHILNFGVDHEHRRRGIATLLLKRFLKRAQNSDVKFCYLEVREGNRGAQKFYYKNGFAPLTARKNYYPDGEGALILIKKL